MRRVFAASVAVLGMLVLTTGAGAITYGFPDGNGHPEVSRHALGRQIRAVKSGGPSGRRTWTASWRDPPLACRGLLELRRLRVVGGGRHVTGFNWWQGSGMLSRNVAVCGNRDSRSDDQPSFC